MINTYSFAGLSDQGDIMVTSNSNPNETISVGLVIPLSSLMRRHRRLQRSLDNEDNNESEKDNEEYIDFRNYPLNINWAEVNNENSDSYEIFENYGHIALYVYNQLYPLSKAQLKCPETYLNNVIEIYFNACYNNHTNNQMTKFKLLESFLPNMPIFHNIILSETYSKKEIIFIKLLLDIYHHYYFHYDKYNSEMIVDYFIPACLVFYSKLKKEDIVRFNAKATNLNFDNKLLNRQVKKYIKKDQEHYIKFYLNLKKNYDKLFACTQKEDFIQ